MYREEVCMKCGRKLTYDEIGLHKKLINRGSTEFMCISCLGEKFGATEQDLRHMIDYFKKSGCTLFC